MNNNDLLANGVWFVLHVGVGGFGISYLLNEFVFELETYQWFLAPLGAGTTWYQGFLKNPLKTDEASD